eukprot:COSAG04_NODE_4765_length_1904_cov_1.177285_1_plen_43_part_10
MQRPEPAGNLLRRAHWHGYTWGANWVDAVGKTSSPGRFQLFRV